MFVHLRCRSSYTFGLSLLQPADIAHLAAEAGMHSVAMVDRNLFGVMEFSRGCKSRKLKAILGLEIFLVEDGDAGPVWPMAILAENAEGYQNLVKISSRFDRGGQGVILSLLDLEAHRAGLVGLCGGRNGHLRQLIWRNRIDAARKWVLRFQDLFIGRFYLEASPSPREDGEAIKAAVQLMSGLLGNPGPKQRNAEAVRQDLTHISKDLWAPLVATRHIACKDGDEHRLNYWKPSVRPGLAKHDPRFTGVDTAWISDARMKESFDEGVMGRTLEVDGLIESIDLNRTTFAGVGVVAAPLDWQKVRLRILAEEGLRIRCSGDPSADYMERLENELRWIENSPTGDRSAGFLLHMASTVECLRIADIRLGPGIGTIPGCLIAYCLGIHETDSLKAKLSFERWFRPGNLSRIPANGYIHLGLEQAGKAVKALAEAFPGLHAATLFPKEPIPNPLSIEGYRPHLPTGCLTALKTDDGNMGGPFAQSHLIQVPPGSSIPCWNPEEGDIQIPVAQLSDWDAEDLDIPTISLYHDPAIDVLENLLQEAEDRGVETARKWDLADSDVFENIGNLDLSHFREVASKEGQDLLRKISPETFDDLVCFMALSADPGRVDAFFGLTLPWEARLPCPPWAEAILRPSRGILLFDEQVLDLAECVGMSAYDAEDLRRVLRHGTSQRKTICIDAFQAQARQRGLEGVEWVTDAFVLQDLHLVNKAHCVSRSLLMWQIAWLQVHLGEVV